MLVILILMVNHIFKVKEFNFVLDSTMDDGKVFLRKSYCSARVPSVLIERNLTQLTSGED